MPRPVLILLALLIGLTAFAPPGLCPCWLMMDIRAYHPHPSGHPEASHNHDYLNDLFSTGLAAVASLALIPAHALIALLTTPQLWRHIIHDFTFAHGWIPSLDPPPPRLTASFTS